MQGRRRATSTLRDGLLASVVCRSEAARLESTQRLMDQLRDMATTAPLDALQLLPTLCAFATEVPFADVRERLADFIVHAYGSAESRRAGGVLTAVEEAAVEAFVRSAGDLAVLPSPSRFIAREFLVPSAAPGADAEHDEKVSEQLVQLDEHFVASGRVLNVIKVVASHPTYLHALGRAQLSVMQEDGPLPVTWRYYIGMMAAARHRCSYLVRRCQLQFLLHGGDIDWLTPTASGPPPSVPRKLTSLDTLNATMAHKPWDVDKSMVGSLMERGEHASWSVNELAHAMVILAMYHSLSSCVFGLGVELEPDVLFEDGGGVAAASPLASGSAASAAAAASDSAGAASLHAAVSPVAAAAGTDALRGARPDVDGAGSAAAASVAAVPATPVSNAGVPSTPSGAAVTVVTTATGAGGAGAGAAAASTPGLGKRPQSVDSEGCKDAMFKSQLLQFLRSHGGLSDDEDEPAASAADVFETAGRGAEVTASSALLTTTTAEFRCLTTVPLAYVDFQSEWGVLRTQEFCWEDHCFSLLAKYFPAAADALDTLFSVTFNLTYHDFGEGEVTGTDTTPFRQAVWYYVHRLFGICNDDYDYLLVNQTMDKDIKKYVKQCSCFPENVSFNDFDVMDPLLRKDEKIHINILAVEARKQAELLRALHALMSHVNG